MIRLQISFWMTLLLWVERAQGKPFGSFSTNRRNVPSNNLLASVSFEMDDIDELLVAPSTSIKKKSSAFDLQTVAESIVKSVAAVLFARCFFALTGKRTDTDTSNNSSDKEESSVSSSSFSSSSSSSTVPPLPSNAEWKEIIERVNYLQATLHDYYEMWNRQMDEHDTGMNTGWVTCMEVAEQNAHVIHELNAKLEDLRHQILQGPVAQQVSEEETIVETTTTVEHEETPVSEEEVVEE